MKLAAHYNKASIIISISVLLISGFVYYAIINHIARQQLDNDLSEEIEEVVDYVNLNGTLPKPVEFDEDQTSYIKTPLKKYDTHFFDTPYNNPKEKCFEAGRGVSGLIKAGQQNYIVTIVESRKGTEHLIQIISLITVGLTAVLLLVLIVTNTYVLSGLWRPFYHLLGQIKSFNVVDTGKLDVMQNKVDEFEELNSAVTKMSSRVVQDYQSLKTFTENASHEMMTPLAVINSKLDTLIQDETLSSDQYNQISDIYSQADKLARLNQSLLLLVKIDNNQLNDGETVDLGSIVTEKAQQFQELIQNKNIDLEVTTDTLKINASRYLVDVLLNNLFSNAIRHNRENGKIMVAISGRRLSFCNTSQQGPLNNSAVFERFYKGKNSDGTGLGLAIMKNICTRYHFNLQYRYDNNTHCFIIDF